MPVSSVACAFLLKHNGGGEADAAVSAGDDCHFSFQPFHDVLLGLKTKTAATSRLSAGCCGAEVC
jgi:hypothetical protein